MNLRPANPADLDGCERLDGAYHTDHVWQMQVDMRPDNVGTTFRRVRTPRPIEVPYPNPPGDLYAAWRRKECLLVAYERTAVLGFLQVTVSRGDWRGWLEHLIVQRAVRRQGIATSLLDAAERWAHGSELGSISVTLQNRNDPAVQLFTRRGYAYRGYLDHFFANRDPGLIYTLYL